ncbi:hypothetical protein ACC771_25995, partial [Rhizobium ruizarguesonis]
AEARCGRKPHRRPVEAKLIPTLMTTAAISLSLAKHILTKLEVPVTGNVLDIPFKTVDGRETTLN